MVFVYGLIAEVNSHQADDIRGAVGEGMEAVRGHTLAAGDISVDNYYKDIVVQPPIVSDKRVGQYTFDYDSKYVHSYENSKYGPSAFCSFNKIFSLILKQQYEGDVAVMCAHANYDPTFGPKPGNSFCLTNKFIKIYPHK